MAFALRKEVDGDWKDKADSLRRDLLDIQNTVNALSREGASVSLYQVGTQGIPNTTWTRVGFGFVDGQDNAHLWQGDFRLIIPTAGRYALTFQSPFSSAGAGSFQVKITNNGIDCYGSGLVVSAVNPGSLSLSYPKDYAVGDILIVSVYQDSGGLLTIGSTNPAFYTRVSLDRIG